MRLLLPGLLLLSGCPGASDTDSDTDVDTAAPMTEPDVPTSACAATSYEWLPFDQVGEIVSIEPAEDLSVSSGLIDLGLSQVGLGDLTPVPYSVRAWRVRYVTQDQGRAVEATAVLALPDTDEPLDAPSVVWAHGTTGFTDACAPSAGGLEENIGAILLASQGYAVAQPDYIGMNGLGEPAEDLHPYLVVEPAAVATLDSVRALWSLPDAVDDAPPVTPTTTLALWGGSEGGFHVLWADRYVTHYLPQAQLVATVAAVPPSDLQGLALEAVAEGPVRPVTGGLIAGAVGQATWYGDRSVLDELLVEPLPTQVPAAMGNGCSAGDAVDDIQTPEDAFLPDALSQARQGAWPEPFACFLEEGTLRRSTIPRNHDAPVFFQVSGADELVVGSVIAQDAGRLCEAGYRLDYLECAGANHTEGAAQSLPTQLR